MKTDNLSESITTTMKANTLTILYLNQSFIAVSYTHLDVYKRQAIMIKRHLNARKTKSKVFTFSNIN